MVRKLVVNGETVVLSDEVLNKLRHQEYIEEGKRIVKTLGLNNIYNKMTDDVLSRRRTTVRHLCGKSPYNRDWMRG